MRNKLLLTAALLILFIPLAATAQESFDFELEHTEAYITEPTFYQFHATLSNNSSVQDVYVITRVSVDAPDGWTSSLCTHHFCAPPFTDEVNDTLAPGGSDNLVSLDVNAAQDATTGDRAVIALKVASTNNPDDYVEYTFTLTIGTNSAVESNAQPVQFALHPVYPNPFNAMSRISFTLPQASNVHLVVMSVDGRIVQTLADGVLPAGNHQRVLTSTPQMASGTYLVTLQAGDKSFIQRAVLLK